MRPLLLIVVFMATISLASAQTTPSSAAAMAKLKGQALAIVAPPPKYPVDAKGRHPTGRGIVVMDVDMQTGQVTSARMEKSTGNKLLDDAAVEAFSRWRFRPGHFKHVRSPIAFTNGSPPKT
jgi:TonB family protein